MLKPPSPASVSTHRYVLPVVRETTAGELHDQQVARVLASLVSRPRSAS